MKLPNLGGFIPPKTSLRILRNEIKKQLGIDFVDYSIVYYHAEGKLDYHILGKKYYHDDGGKLASFIRVALESKLQTNDKIDVAIIDYNENDTSYAKIAYVDEHNLKQLLTIKF